MKPNIKRRQFYGQKKIVLWLHNGVYKVAEDYADHVNCPIATAIRQQFTNILNHNLGVGVSPWEVNINGVNYYILGDSGACSVIEHAAENGDTIPVILQRA